MNIKKPEELEIEILPYEFCIAKVSDYSKADLSEPFTFTGSTDHEKSLICKKENVPDNVLNIDEGYAGLRIKGILDFSFIGILAKIERSLHPGQSVLSLFQHLIPIIFSSNRINLKKQ